MMLVSIRGGSWYFNPGYRERARRTGYRRNRRGTGAAALVFAA